MAKKITPHHPLLTLALGLSAALAELEQIKLVMLDAIWQLRQIAKTPPATVKRKRGRPRKA